MISSLVPALISAFKARRELALENVALRQQLAVLRRSVKRPRLSKVDRGFWVLLRRIWTDWESVLVIVKPETVIRWHRCGFRRYWTWKSRRRRPGRPGVAPEIRELIRNMSRANPLWGAPRVHGELAKLGISISQAAVSKYMVRHRTPPSHTWRSFLDNHVKDLVSLDFFTLPTATFRVLFVFIVLRHDRRRIVSFQCHRTSFRRVDGTANGRCFSMGYSASVPGTGPRPDLRSVLRHSRRRSRDRAGPYRTALPVAESISRKDDRLHST